MDILIPLQAQPMDDEDPTRDYVVQALARISAALGKDFTKYLQYVMPTVLKTAASEIPLVQPDDDFDEEQLIEEGFSSLSRSSSLCLTFLFDTFSATLCFVSFRFFLTPQDTTKWSVKMTTLSLSIALFFKIKLQLST